MAARATDAEVRAIRPSTVIPGPNGYDPYIAAASAMVDEIAAGCGSTYSDDLLKQIEIFLAGHLAGATDPQLTQEKFENASKTYERGSSGGAGILSTQYGQTANMLSRGCLLQLDMQSASVSFA